MPDVHDELRRLVLRARWIRWSLRNYRDGDYKKGTGRHMVLSDRLSRIAPTWEERGGNNASEDEL
jgi:hypothetical protein